MPLSDFKPREIGLFTGDDIGAALALKEFEEGLRVFQND
jgi:hypothetical protein